MANAVCHIGDRCHKQRDNLGVKNEVCDHTLSNKSKTETVRGRNLGALPDGEEPSILYQEV